MKLEWNIACFRRVGSWVALPLTLSMWPMGLTKQTENLSEWQYLKSIKNEGKIYTACGDGKIPFISATDIAAVAFHALTDSKITGTSVRVIGPELLTYDEVCTVL